MPRDLAQRLNAVAPSMTLAMNARADGASRAKGVDVFAFGVGEPDFEPPAHVLEAAKRAIDAGASKYTAVTGIPALKEAICDATERMRGWRPEARERLRQRRRQARALQPRARALRAGGRGRHPEALLGELPRAGAHRRAPRRCSCDTREEDGWSCPPPALERALTPRTKAIILCSPSNPTGAAYDEDEHPRASSTCSRRHDCWLIVDEIYAELVYEGFKFVSAAKLAAATCAGLRAHHHRRRRVEDVRDDRAGASAGRIAPAPLTKALDMVQGQSTTNATAVAQHAAIAALSGPLEEFAADARGVREAPRTRWSPGSAPSPASAAASPRARSTPSPTAAASTASSGTARRSTTDEDIAFWLLDKAHVAAVPGGRVRRARLRAVQLRDERGAHQGGARALPRRGGRELGGRPHGRGSRRAVGAALLLSAPL